MADNSKKYSLAWLKQRMADGDCVYKEFQKADELWSVLKVAGDAGIALPCLRRDFFAEWSRIHRLFSGNNSIPPEEVLFRAKVLASVASLVNDGVTDDTARAEASAISGATREDIRKWIAKYDAAVPSVGRQYMFSVDHMAGFFRGEIAKQRNQKTVLGAVKELFAQ